MLLLALLMLVMQFQYFRLYTQLALNLEQLATQFLVNIVWADFRVVQSVVGRYVFLEIVRGRIHVVVVAMVVRHKTVT